MSNRRTFISQSLAAALGIYTSPLLAFAKDAPSSQPYNVLLGRPTFNSITISLYTTAAGNYSIAYGKDPNKLSLKTATHPLIENTVATIVLDRLQANQIFYYQVQFQAKASASIEKSETYRFCTPRKKGEKFVCTITADSHLGTAKHCDPALYQQTLRNVAKDQPDLHFALGDEFRASKVKAPDYNKIEALYTSQRTYLSKLCANVPYFFILGNHELEAKAYDNGTDDCLAAWSAKARKKFIPNPIPNQFYTGNTIEQDRQNYYAFEWGDVLFVTLDVFWYSNISVEDEEMREQQKVPMENLSKEERMQKRAERQQDKQQKKTGDGNAVKKDPWSFTIGDAQYHWLQHTLANSTCKYKFVLGHHVMGSCRGAIEWATSFEWGGKTKKGTTEFANKRPNWAMPIHQLFVQHKVTAFIQGHDHLFARQNLDGVAYITCPMCADPGYNTYNSEGYLSGDKLSNTGHLKIEVTPEDVQMQYIKAVLPKDEAQQGANAHVAYHWSFMQQKQIQHA